MKMLNSKRVKTVLAVVGAAILIYLGLTGIFGERAAPTVLAQQTDLFLSRRIDQLEQRFYQLESKIDRVEQESRRPAVASPSIAGGNDTEIRLLRSELDSMRIRLGEAECSLLRVDERTLTAAARASRKKAMFGGTENCRVNPGAVVELSARP